MLRPSRNVEKDSHPAVFVALGSHANYFYGPEICPNDKTIGHTQAEIMDQTGKAAALIPEMRLLPDRKDFAVKPQAWLDIGGTNIFADVMLDGRLYRGATGMAIEIGHVPIEPDGPLCACGMHGCPEALASGPAIARQFQECVCERLVACAVNHPWCE